MLLPPLGVTGWAPGSWQCWAELAAQLRPPPWIHSSPAQICGWASSSGSGKEKGWICRDKQVVSGRGKGRFLLHAFRLPHPNGCSSTVAGVAGLLDPWPQGTSNGLQSLLG